MSPKSDEFPDFKYLCKVVLIGSIITSQAMYLLLFVVKTASCWGCTSLKELGKMWLYFTGISVPLMFLGILSLLFICKFLWKVVKT